MLPLVETSSKKLEKYKGLISENLFLEIKEISKNLKGLKVNFVNSTPRGGGVAELLKSLVPLMKGVGIKAEWYTIPGGNDFFKITKEIHNALQGKDYSFPFSHRKKYLNYLKKTAKIMHDMKADIWVINDPQPAGIISFLPNLHPSVCRLHIDLTSPNREVWNFISELLKNYDKIVLSSKKYIKPEIKKNSVVVTPAIDPLVFKNRAFYLKKANQILKNFGINSEFPLISQVSRFDPWKDPIGVIRSYQIAKKKIPNLQLALVGFFLARDDPEALKIYKIVKKETLRDPDIFLFADVDKIDSLRVDAFVNAVQVASDVILQKSIREGFGLTVSEAMWKEKPVIGGNVGGIKTQIKDKKNGFLVNTSQQAAQRIVQLIENPDLAKKLGQAAKKTVREKFLMPRLLKDHLNLYKKLVNK